MLHSYRFGRVCQTSRRNDLLDLVDASYTLGNSELVPYIRSHLFVKDQKILDIVEYEKLTNIKIFGSLNSLKFGHFLPKAPIYSG